MKQKTITILHTIATMFMFLALVIAFAIVSIAITFAGIYLAFQLWFSVGWWAGILVVLVVLAIFAAALSIALEVIERKTK